MSGLRSAVASGATTIGQTGFMQIDNSNGPQFASIKGYEGVDAASARRFRASARIPGLIFRPISLTYGRFVWWLGKEKARCGGMNAAGLVEPTVVETATSSMRTKRSTN